MTHSIVSKCLLNVTNFKDNIVEGVGWLDGCSHTSIINGDMTISPNHLSKKPVMWAHFVCWIIPNYIWYYYRNYIMLNNHDYYDADAVLRTHMYIRVCKYPCCIITFSQVNALMLQKYILYKEFSWR